MADRTKIVQNASNESTGMQIGIQNNYGISAEKASELALKLFMDNFPKLQEEAAKIARERAEELCEETLTKLLQKGQSNFDEFKDPDIQYMLYEAQKGYARFGAKDNLTILSELISNRVVTNNKDYLKRVFDKAIEIAVSLSPKQIDYLSFMFMGKMVKFNEVKDIETLKQHCNYVCDALEIDFSSRNMISYLNMLGCLEINLGTASEIIAKTYNFSESDVKSVLPKQYEYIHCDYNLSPAAIAIAIINAECKTRYRFNFNIWIKE